MRSQNLHPVSWWLGSRDRELSSAFQSVNAAGVAAPSWYHLKGKPAPRVGMKRVLGRGEHKWAGWGFTVSLHWRWQGVDGMLGSPPALPGPLRLSPVTALGSVYAVVVVQCKRSTHSLSSLCPVAPFPSHALPPREKSWLFLSLPGLFHRASQAQDRWPWGKGNLFSK